MFILPKISSMCDIQRRKFLTVAAASTLAILLFQVRICYHFGSCHGTRCCWKQNHLSFMWRTMYGEYHEQTGWCTYHHQELYGNGVQNLWNGGMFHRIDEGFRETTLVPDSFQPHSFQETTVNMLSNSKSKKLKITKDRSMYK